MKILITGASGAGATTLGAALASRLSFPHLDTDEYFWLPTTPPFKKERASDARLSLLQMALAQTGNAVLSGNVMGWGSDAEDAFDLIVFLYVPTSLRLDRLQRRETERWGSADPAFLKWAADYDDGPPAGRSLAKHRAWLESRQCAVLSIDGDTSVEDCIARIVTALGQKD